MKQVKKVLSILLVLFIIIIPLNVYGSPYDGYAYNEWNRAVPSQIGYLPDRVISGEDMGAGRLKNPQDIFVAKNKTVFILDSGNNRLVILEKDFTTRKILDTFTDESGAATTLSEPGGVFVDGDGVIYIADTGNNRVLICDKDGMIRSIITKPDVDIFPNHSDFRPQRVLADTTGNIYVIVAGVFQGAVMFGQDGRFLGFYGSNRVELSAKVLRDLFWKRIMSREQKQNMERYVPIEYISFDIDDENFIYTCTAKTASGFDEIRKLNPMGDNIFKSKRYGDVEGTAYKGQWFTSNFVDIKIDAEELIYALDTTRGRIFQYDREGNQVFVFGGKGDQAGLFKSPRAIETLDGNVLILDAQKGNVTIFKPTKFGREVLYAIKLYNEGMYEDAIEPWKDVLRMNATFSLAYVSIGKSYYNISDYKTAQWYFKMGSDRSSESKAFREYRTLLVRQNFGLIITLFITAALAIFAVRKREKLRYAIRSIFRY